MTNKSEAASSTQPRTCPTCGSDSRAITVKRRCEMTAPPELWKWVKDERLTCTDFIECADPWHDVVSRSQPEMAQGREEK